MEDIFTAIERLGYEQQEGEAHCSFKIVLNNCAETTLYFKKKECIKEEDYGGKKDV